MRKAIAGAVVGALLTFGGTALAHHGELHRAVYRQVRGSDMFPARVVIRCEGWAEDSARLRLVDYSRDLAVYRCIAP